MLCEVFFKSIIKLNLFLSQIFLYLKYNFLTNIFSFSNTQNHQNENMLKQSEIKIKNIQKRHSRYDHSLSVNRKKNGCLQCLIILYIRGEQKYKPIVNKIILKWPASFTSNKGEQIIAIQSSGNTCNICVHFMFNELAKNISPQKLLSENYFYDLV